MLKYRMLLCLACYACLSSAQRDPFAISAVQGYGCDFQFSTLEDFHYLGSISMPNTVLGFVENALGETCVLKVGQIVGAKKMSVLRIMPNEILLSDGRHHQVIQ